jgi:hypothetical protein
MIYEVEGSNVTLSLSADELNEVIDALETVNSESKLLEAWYEFLQRGVCPNTPDPGFLSLIRGSDNSEAIVLFE